MFLTVYRRGLNCWWCAVYVTLNFTFKAVLNLCVPTMYVSNTSICLLYNILFQTNGQKRIFCEVINTSHLI